MRFPRLVIPLSVAMTSLFNLGMNLIAVLVFAVVEGISPPLSWLSSCRCWYSLFGDPRESASGMLLSALYVRFRDIQPIWEVLAQVLFYGSPIIYTAGQATESWSTMRWRPRRRCC